MKPIIVLFNVTTEIFDDGIVNFISDSMNTEIFVNGLMQFDRHPDQFGNLIVRFDTDIDLQAFLIAWKLANSYELQYFICRGTPEKIYETFHVEKIDE